MKKILFSILLVLSVTVLHAHIRLPNILGSNMVLQQQSTTKLWGWASPGEKIRITTSWDKKVTEVTTDANANWATKLSTPTAGGPYMIVFEGENKIVLQNVLIGEVWVCSGQSNMEWNYERGITSIKNEFEHLKKLNIRLFNIPKSASATQQDHVEGIWTTCDSNSLKKFSAVGYYFGKQLHNDLNVPIGLINSNWGGTPGEVWTPGQLVENDAELKEAAAKIEPATRWPVKPGYAYNAMIAPIVNYNIAGVIWYQGESNVNASASYTRLINTMLSGWRKAWNNDFPFYYVQIAPFKYNRYHVGALLREAQTQLLSVPKTGMVVVSDLVNDTLNIHPTNKAGVGLRLGNLALAETYGLKKTGFKNPVFKSLVIENNNAVVELNHAETGIKITDQTAREIFIAGADKIFYPAEVKLKKNKIYVSSKNVPKPQAVRYQFSNAGVGNLISREGLPVAPFRTDNWVIDTAGIK